MTEEDYFKAQRIRELIVKMESVLRTVRSACRISASVRDANGVGCDGVSLSDNKDVDATIRKGMVDALEKRIEELRQEFEKM